jgi:hypothetical protein
MLEILPLHHFDVKLMPLREAAVRSGFCYDAEKLSQSASL